MTASITLLACGVMTTLASPPAGTTMAADIAQRGQKTVVCKKKLTDAPNINAAISASAVGDEIVICGQCLIDRTIKLRGDRSYRGTSRTGTVLKQADGANLVAILATDTFLENKEWTGTPVSIRQMTLDGNSEMNQQAQTDGVILRSWLSVVEDVRVTDMSGNGLKLTNKSANGTGLATTQVNGRISNTFIEDSGRHGIYVEDSQNAVTDWTLIDNWIASSGVDGVHLENAAGWTIERNHIYGVPQNAIYAHRLWGTSISDNYLEDFGETKQTGSWHGIYATIQGGAASTISNNRVFNLTGENNPLSTYRYVFVSVNQDTGMVAVTGNTVRGSGLPDEIGLDYSATGGQKLVVTSSGNLVENVKTKRTTSGRVVLSGGY